MANGHEPKNETHGEDLEAAKAWLVYGGNGHEKEYVFTTELTGAREFLPRDIGEIVKQELGNDWDVCDRRTRIEIACINPYGARDDEKVRMAFEKALSETEQKYYFLPTQ